MANKIKSKWDKLDERVQKWATRLGAIATIIGILAAGGGWLVNQLDNSVAVHIEAQTQEIQQEVQKLTEKVGEHEEQSDLQLTRLELMNLIQLDPNNVIEIEKVAKHYFVDLQGDWYLTSVYSKWAKQYGGNMDFIVMH